MSEQFEVVDSELKGLRGRLAIESQALAKLQTEYDAACILVVDDQEAAAEAVGIAKTIAFAEARVRGLEVLVAGKEKSLKELEAARDVTVAAELAKKAELDLEQKQIRLTSAVRVARERTEELKSRIPGAIALVGAAQARFAMADHGLQRHLDRQLDPFATSDQVQKHEDRGARLAAERETARNECNDAIEAHLLAQKAYSEACGQLLHAQNVLRWNCPPTPEEQRRNTTAVASV